MPDSPSPPRRFCVIGGPTAGGKSALAMALARRLAALGRRPEIIAADAFQIYRGMDIGTAKPSPADRAEFPHHLIDVVSPTDRFTVDDWRRAAEGAIADIRRRDGLPIVVGGTHLYIKALLDGLFDGPPPDPALRAALAATPPAELRRELERADPVAAARIHPNDARRTVRALEVYRQTGRPISALQSQWDNAGTRADALLVTIYLPTDELNRRINARVRRMLADGLVAEIRALLAAGGLGPQAAEALGYKQLIPLLSLPEAARPDIPPALLDEAVERIKIETRRFAKNQRTWLRRLSATPGAIRIESPDAAGDEAVERIVGGLCPDSIRTRANGNPT